MHKVLVMGAGNIGSLVGCLLAQGGYQVYLADASPPKINFESIVKNLKHIVLDVTDTQSLENFSTQNQIEIFVSCLPFYFNTLVAQIAKKLKIHYFDTTEDVEVADFIKKLAKHEQHVFVPRCGLAPGYINILASDLMKEFERVESVELRVGDIPININNTLQYALSWSTDGLINEYANPCYAIAGGHKVTLEPLEDLEIVEIDGRTYEAFNTSGGIGSLVDTYQDKVNKLNYKTLRYPGHCAKMRFLMKDLRLSEDRPTLKRILENVLPRTVQEVVLVYVAITGLQQSQFVSKAFVNKIYPQKIFEHDWTAIQNTTASSLCAVLDIVINNFDRFHGLVLQEQIPLKEFLQNRFGKIFDKKI